MISQNLARQNKANQNPGNTDLCTILWLDLTIYGSKLEQYTHLNKHCSVHAHARALPELFQSQPIDIIVLEYDYPIKESLEVLSDLKKEHASIPIIMLTEQHSEELAVWAFRARAWDYFVKPLAQDKLLASVDTIMEIKDNHKQDKNRTPVTPPNIKPMETRFNDINEEYRAISPALSFLDNNYQKKVSESTLASLCGMNPFRFSRCFKKEIGVTLQEYIVRLRIREALRLLDNPVASITDIALMVGFNDTSYFSRTFRKYMNYSPSEFRSMQQDNGDDDSAASQKNVETLSRIPDCIEAGKSEEEDRKLLQDSIKLMNALGQEKHSIGDDKKNIRILDS